MAVVRALRSGDASGFERFFDHVFAPLYAHVLALVRGDATAATDICQRTLVHCIENLARFRGDEPLQSWVRNVANDLLHSQSIEATSGAAARSAGSAA
jgi:RNA polymerase sigma-70 factor (ECF subfamily)